MLSLAPRDRTPSREKARELLSSVLSNRRVSKIDSLLIEAGVGVVGPAAAAQSREGQDRGAHRRPRKAAAAVEQPLT
jgi:hypothetical protein